MATEPINLNKYGQSDIVGDLIPNLHINRIILSGGGSIVRKDDPHIKETGASAGDIADVLVTGNESLEKTLRVDLDLSLKDRIDNNMLSSWLFNQPDLNKYFKSVVGMITDEFTAALYNPAMGLREGFSWSGGNRRGLLRAIRENRRSVGEFHDFQVFDLFQPSSEDPNAQENRPIGRTQDATGDFIYDISLQASFFPQNFRPSHLSFITFCYVDIDSLIADYDLSTHDLDSYRDATGHVKVYNVILNNEVVDSTAVLYDPDGNIWQGSVHKHQGRWMAGGSHSNEPHPILTRRYVRNNLVQDFRDVEEIQKRQADLTQFSNIYPSLNKIFSNFVAPNLDVNTNKAFSSDILISRGDRGESKFYFALDYEKLCKENTTYSKLLDLNPSLMSSFKVKRIDMLRRRIVKTNNQDSMDIVSFPEGDRGPPTDKLHAPNEEVISSAKQFGRGLVTEWRPDVKSLSEINLGIGNDDGIRHFVGRDRNISSKTFGIYQYGFEIFIYDPIKDYLGNMLSQLMSARLILKKYHALASIPASEHGGNYNIVNNTFTSDFSQTVGETLGPDAIGEAIASLAEVLVSFGIKEREHVIGFSDSLYQQISPNNGTIKGITFALKLVDDVCAKIQSITGISSAEEGSTSTGATPRDFSGPSTKGTKNIFSHKYYFVNDFFDTELDDQTGFDYLGISDNAPDIQDGFKKITYYELDQRVNAETLKYFTDTTSDITNLTTGQKTSYNYEGHTLDSQKYSFLSPIVVKLKNTEPLETLDQYSTLTQIGRKDSNAFEPSDMAYMASNIFKYNKSHAGIKRVPSFPRSPGLRSHLSHKQAGMRDNLTDLLASTNVTIEISDETSSVRQTEVDFNRAKSKYEETGRNLDEYIQAKDELNRNLIDIHTARDGDSLVANEFLFKLLFNFIVDDEFLSPEAFLKRSNRVRKQTMAYYDLNNVVHGMRDLGDHYNRLNLTVDQAFAGLPNQLKALFVSSIRPEVVSLDYHSRLDPFADPLEVVGLLINYFCLSSVEVATEFPTKTMQTDVVNPGSYGAVPTDLKGTTTVRERNIKKMRFARLTQERISLARSQEATLLCRLRPYVNGLLGVRQPKGLRLDTLDKYFFLVPHMHRQEQRTTQDRERQQERQSAQQEYTPKGDRHDAFDANKEQAKPHEFGVEGTSETVKTGPNNEVKYDKKTDGFHFKEQEEPIQFGVQEQEEAEPDEKVDLDKGKGKDKNKDKYK